MSETIKTGVLMVSTWFCCSFHCVILGLCPWQLTLPVVNAHPHVGVANA